jgi:hypothetical protein
MYFGHYRDLKPLIDELKKKREVQRIGSVFYAFPKEDFPLLRQ